MGTSKWLLHDGRRKPRGRRVPDSDLRHSGAAEWLGDAHPLVEQLGSEILLDTRAGNATFVASVDPTLPVRVHERLKLAVNPERLHLFDARTEAAI